jgi:hypothetical protein
MNEAYDRLAEAVAQAIVRRWLAELERKRKAETTAETALSPEPQSELSGERIQET